MKTITKLMIITVLLMVFCLMLAYADFGKMLCPVCQEKEMTSIVYVGLTLGTLMYCQPHYDEEGNYHYEDPNTYTTSYSCSKGHTWCVSRCGDREWSSIDKYTEDEIVKMDELSGTLSLTGDSIDFFDDDIFTHKEWNTINPIFVDDRWTDSFLSMWVEDGILYVETQDGKWFVEMEKMEE